MFGDRDSGAYLRRFVWTKIVRHQLVGGHSSIDDPALTSYWADRRRRDAGGDGAGQAAEPQVRGLLGGQAPLEHGP